MKKTTIEVPLFLDAPLSGPEVKEASRATRDNTVLSNGNVDTTLYSADVTINDAGVCIRFYPKDIKERREHQHYDVLVPLYDVVVAAACRCQMRFLKEETKR